MTNNPERPAAPGTPSLERPLDDLWRMLRECWDNVFLGYEERWGEKMPSDRYPNDGDTIQRRIVRAVEARVRAEVGHQMPATPTTEEAEEIGTVSGALSLDDLARAGIDLRHTEEAD